MKRETEKKYDDTLQKKKRKVKNTYENNFTILYKIKEINFCKLLKNKIRLLYKRKKNNEKYYVKYNRKFLQ